MAEWILNGNLVPFSHLWYVADQTYKLVQVL